MMYRYDKRGKVYGLDFGIKEWFAEWMTLAVYWSNGEQLSPMIKRNKIHQWEMEGKEFLDAHRDIFQKILKHEPKGNHFIENDVLQKSDLAAVSDALETFAIYIVNRKRFL